MLGMMKGLNRPKTSSSASTSTSTSTSIVGTPPALLLPSPVPSTPELDREREQREREDATCDGCGRNVAHGSKWVLPHVPRGARAAVRAVRQVLRGRGCTARSTSSRCLSASRRSSWPSAPSSCTRRRSCGCLRVGICKGNLKKYSFCLTWIADLLLCRQLRDLRARALEISQISPHVRSEFVRLLTELLSKHRRDIELLTEWQPAQNVAAATTNDPSSNASGNSHSHKPQPQRQLWCWQLWWWWWWRQ
ncbi:hypothetical protein PINS_up021715 [Pythium insidiosum]|nr:hypothetical protein PINS_up021715 [Pythium insidiosum]